MSTLDQRITLYKITKREADVLRLLVRGFTSIQIGSRLCITPGTVNDHVKQLLIKTRTNNRMQLIYLLYDLGSES